MDTVDQHGLRALRGPRRHLLRAWVLALSVLLPMAGELDAAPQLPDFTYQGFLRQNGAPANGAYNFSFTLFNAANGGSQVGATVSAPSFPVVDGVFTQSLAFPGAFNGTQLWLEVSVNGTPMLPRQGGRLTDARRRGRVGHLLVAGPGCR